MAETSGSFFRQVAAIFNSNQSRSVILNGNVYDLFPAADAYLPLLPFLTEKTKIAGLIRVVY